LKMRLGPYSVVSFHPPFCSCLSFLAHPPVSVLPPQ
jgi:hypothetical protein